GVHAAGIGLRRRGGLRLLHGVLVRRARVRSRTREYAVLKAHGAGTAAGGRASYRQDRHASGQKARALRQNRNSHDSTRTQLQTRRSLERVNLTGRLSRSNSMRICAKFEQVEQSWLFSSAAATPLARGCSRTRPISSRSKRLPSLVSRANVWTSSAGPIGAIITPPEAS